MLFLSWVTISWMSFFRHSGAPSHGAESFRAKTQPPTPSENEKYVQKRKKRKTRSCTKSLFVFGRVSLYFRLLQCFLFLHGVFVCFRFLQGVGAGLFVQRRNFRVSSHSAGCRRVTLLFCESSSDPPAKTTQHPVNMQTETLKLHVALVHAPAT